MPQNKRDRAVILGANGTMGVGASTIFAGASFEVAMLARSVEKAREGLVAVQAAARSEAIEERITLGAYDSDLARTVAAANFIYESLAEDLELKRSFLEKVDRCRRPDSIVATGSSGLSITEMARGLSDSMRRNFLGIHLFNPPHIIVGAEVIPHRDTDPAVVARAVEMLSHRLGRKVIVARDCPAFVGNRIGFKVLNEVAQLAARHGVIFMDYLVGPHTGRAMTPLATIDLVGWDVHKAIVDNVFAHCPEDEAHDRFRLPAYMESGLAQGRLGDKAPDQGGFYRRLDRRVEVLDPSSGSYLPLRPATPVDFVEKMKRLHRVGRYAESLGVLREARGPQAELMHRVVLGYVSYALNRVGEVAASNHDVDLIMSFGFNWAPPSVLVDLIGPRETVEMLKRYDLKVPPVVEQAAASGKRLYAGSVLDYGRTFVG